MIDQALHFLAGATIALGAAPFAPWWICLGIALSAGGLRELEQMYRAADWSFGMNRAIDVAFFALGGVAAWWMGRWNG